MLESPRWISVGELARAFAPDGNAPRPTHDLRGRTVSLHLEDGRVIDYRFETGSRLVRKTTEGMGKGDSAAETYFAAKVREGIYFVDFVEQSEAATSVSLALDLDMGIATVLIAQLPEARESGRALVERISQGKELTAVSAIFLSGAVDSPFTAQTTRHAVSDEMVGRRVEYTYSPTERYEHIYLNENLYTWHCLLGSERGLAAPTDATT